MKIVLDILIFLAIVGSVLAALSFVGGIGPFG
jgi:hypothetical protein